MALADFTDKKDKDKPKKSSGYAGFGSGFGSVMTDDTTDIDDLLINYNEKFKNEKPILFRDNVIKKTITCLMGKLKPNALLIGEAGVGKTKIVEDIARKLQTDDPYIPAFLKDYTIYELPLMNLVSGSSLLGELEKKTKAVVDFISEPNNKAILFIDEIHQLAGGGGNNNHYQKIAQILKPAMARSNCHIIGATTSQERANLYSDPAFNRRFTDILVDELTQSQTAIVLKNSLSGFLSHYTNRFSIADDVIDIIPAVADKFSKLGSHRPDNAFTILDRTIAHEILQRTITESNLKAKAYPASGTGDQNALIMLQALQSSPVVAITEDKIRETAKRLSKSESQPDKIDFDELRKKLDVIEGQDDIIDELITLLKRHDMALFPKKKPLSILFAGTSGVGKTEITKIISEYITGVKPIILNMTEYSSSSGVTGIIGVDKGYVGSEDSNELPLDKLEGNPYQIVLLDEFEKADKAVQRLFMGIFDEGILKTKRGSIIDCSKAIFIATTNAGNKEVKRNLGFGETKTETKSEIDIDEFKKWFDAELLNRFEKRYNFHSLSADVYMSILNNTYARELKRIRMDYPVVGNKLPDIIPDEKQEDFRKNYKPDFGARPVYNLVKEYIESQAV